MKIRTQNQYVEREIVFLEAQLEDLLIQCRSIMDRDHLVDEVSRIKHRDPNKPLDNELRLEQILAFLRQTLQKKTKHTQQRFEWYFIG